MVDRLTQRSWWSTFSTALIGLLMLSLVAACGSDDADSDADSDTTASTTATGSGGTTSTATEASGMATEADTDDGTAASGDMGEAMAIGACIQANTTSDIATDLRDGDTKSAEGVYRECLSDALPPAMVDQLDPIIEQAGECGSEAAADLSDDDIASIEGGDEATITQITTDTLECLSTNLGIDLQ
ncbi:MAG: hypothetical protein M3439_12000 [Chloroflexota bacterium]|nr:hypothetical protein [Chloroflexota bacterium]